MSGIGELAARTPPSQWCQLFFVLAATSIVVLQLVPPSARDRLQNYGARAAAATGGASDGAHERRSESGGGDWVERLAAAAASVGQVPHAWFVHFYVASVAWSAFWGWQLSTRGVAATSIAGWEARTGGGPSMALGQVAVAWAMMACQGSRRLYECVAVAVPSSSRMWFVHWLLAVVHYSVMGISVWVEGSRAILRGTWEDDVDLVASTRILLSLVVFAVASVKQHQCHRYLASLKKYSLPDEGLFRFLICPHYTCECLIYASLAVAAAPRGQLLNRTITCGLAFVAANLGATAKDTKDWYGRKFGAEKVARKWRMVPLVF